MATAKIRAAAVAGMFYPGDPAVLRSQVDQLLAAAPAPEGKRPKAVIAPHAGYVYSGPVAATAFRALTGHGGGIRRIVLVGPSHRVPFAGLGLDGADAFATPLGAVPVDRELVERVAGLPQVSLRPDAHAGEHSLEVEIPFLQTLLPDFTLLPLVVGEASAESVAEVLEAVWGGEETAVVVSSDLSHYLPYDEARRVDEETAGAILRLEGPIHGRRACGARPISGLLAVARRRRLAVRLLDLRSSGDTAGGRREVVGYGAFAFGENGGDGHG